MQTMQPHHICRGIKAHFDSLAVIPDSDWNKLDEWQQQYEQRALFPLSVMQLAEQL